MDAIEKRINELNLHLPVKVMMYSFLPSNVGPKQYSKLRSGASGWVDTDRGVICLYRPNLAHDPSKIDAVVAFQGAGMLGMRAFLGESTYRSVCNRLGRMLLRSEGCSQRSQDELTSVGEHFLSKLGDKHTKQWDDVAYFVSELTGLENSFALAESLCKGTALFRGREHRQAVGGNDFDRLDRDIYRQLQEHSADRGMLVSLGTASSVFERVGYPPLELKVSADALREFRQRRGLDGDTLPSRCFFGIHDPMAIVRSSIKAKDGKQQQNVFVTGHHISGHGFLSFTVESASDVLKGVQEGRYSYLRVRSVTTMSEFSLLQALSVEESIRYLKPKGGEDGTGYVVSDYLRRMEGRSIEELGYKKSVRGTAPSFTSSHRFPRLIMTANIVENFKNPMSSEKRKQLFGETKYESMVAAKQNIRNELKSTNPASPVPVIRSIERTYRERLSTYLDESFGPVALKRLSAAGITRAMDLISMGEEAVRQAFGTRTYRSACSFLEANGLSFGGSVKIRTISEDHPQKGTPEGALQVRATDLVNSLGAIPENVISRSVRMPRTADGTYLSGPGAVNLIAKSVSLPRWRDCNIFVTPKDITDYGLQVDKGAVPCHILDAKGDDCVVYNLSETDFAKNHPSLFDSVSQMSRQTSAEVPTYLKNVIYGLKGVKTEEALGVYQFVENGYSRNVSAADLEPSSLSLRKLSNYSSRELDIRNPLETRGCKSAREAYEQIQAAHSKDLSNQKKR